MLSSSKHRTVDPAIVAFGISLAACGAQPPQGAEAGAANVFVAFTDDFAGFRHWQSFPVLHDADAGLVSDDAGVHMEKDPLVEYVKSLPSSGVKKFPIGTIIVKEVDTGDIPDRKVFAMVKRGGNFDAKGAVNWEWFELINLSASSVRIAWRGNGPKAGEKYGGDPRVCNGCHLSSQNDAVLSSALQLSNF